MKTLLDWLEHNKEWVFSGIGISGITAAVLIARWIYSRLKPKPKALHFTMAFGNLTYEGPPYLGSNQLLFKVANPGDKPVQLTGFSLPLKSGHNVVFPRLQGERSLPCPVPPGITLNFWTELADIQSILRERGYSDPAAIHATATDGLGREYASNTLSVGLSAG